MRVPRWFGAVSLLALLAAGPALAAGGKKPPPPPPAPAAQAEKKAPSDAEVAKAFEPFTTAIASGNKEGALDALVAIVNDPTKEAFHGRAWTSMGGVLQSMELPASALAAYSKGIKLDPANAGKSVGSAIELADKLHDTAMLEQVFADNVGLEVDASQRGRLAYLAARGAYADTNYSTALGILQLVPKADPLAGKAQLLRGVIMAQQGRWSDAMAALVTAEALLKDQPADLDLVYLNTARVYYGAENYPRAIEYFAKVSRESFWWPEAQFERAWAHFRIQDVNGALSLLQTHSSPFYEGWYFPEAQLLRTYSLFMMCKFPEASKQIALFEETWKPIRDEAKGKVAAMSPGEAWKDARAFVEGKESSLGPLFLREFTQDETLADSFKAVDMADAELQTLGSKSGAWTQVAKDLVKERRDDLVKSQGERVLRRAQARIDQLSGMLTDVQIAKLDMLSLETKLYEMAAKSGEMPDIDKKANRKERVRKGYQQWPFEGEYWADEVGYYRVEAIPECPAGLMAG